MKTYVAYAATFEPTEREGGFTVTFADIPEAITEGDDMAEAREMAADALGIALLTYLETGRPLPEPMVGGMMIAPGPEVAAKIAAIEAHSSQEGCRTKRPVRRRRRHVRRPSEKGSKR